MWFYICQHDIKEPSLTGNFSNTWKIEVRSHKLQDESVKNKNQTPVQQRWQPMGPSWVPWTLCSEAAQSTQFWKHRKNLSATSAQQEGTFLFVSDSDRLWDDVRFGPELACCIFITKTCFSPGSDSPTQAFDLWEDLEGAGGEGGGRGDRDGEDM